MQRTAGICALMLAITLLNSCNKDKPDHPTVRTTGVADITYSTATVRGEVVSEGADPVLARGICWSTTAEPTIEDNITAESGTKGSFASQLSGLAPDTKYYVKAYATNGIGTGYGEAMTFTTTRTLVPVLTTNDPSYIGPVSAVSGGVITDDNGSSIVARGVCWSLTPGPTASGNKSSAGSGSGSFSGAATQLAVNTTYYLRAWATNRSGTGYGNEITFTTTTYGTVADIDGNNYRTIIIGAQEWMADNLRTTTYSNGEAIPNIQGDDEWSQLIDGAYCWYENTELPNKTLYGGLYNWFTVTDDRGLCPTGWHVPDDADWSTLTDFLTAGGYGYGGSGDDIAKSVAASTGWTINAIPGTIGNDQTTNNSSGFEAVPGGVRIKSGPFSVAGYTCSLWSTSNPSFTYGNAIILSGEYTNLFRGYTFKQDGASVRCLKNN